jgi:hypothetical protein
VCDGAPAVRSAGRAVCAGAAATAVCGQCAVPTLGSAARTTRQSSCAHSAVHHAHQTRAPNTPAVARSGLQRRAAAYSGAQHPCTTGSGRSNSLPASGEAGASGAQRARWRATWLCSWTSRAARSELLERLRPADCGWSGRRRLRLTRRRCGRCSDSQTLGLSDAQTLGLSACSGCGLCGALAPRRGVSCSRWLQGRRTPSDRPSARPSAHPSARPPTRSPWRFDVTFALSRQSSSNSDSGLGFARISCGAQCKS